MLYKDKSESFGTKTINQSSAGPEKFQLGQPSTTYKSTIKDPIKLLKTEPSAASPLQKRAQNSP